MDTHTTDRTPPMARAVRPDCCADEKCSSGSRNNYFTGKRLTPDAFRAEQKYLVDRRHLLNRAIHGWGVVYGFGVETAAVDKGCPGAELGTLVIGEGLALDRTGRELVQAARRPVTLESVTVLDDKGAPVRANGCDAKERMSRLKPTKEECWLLKVHYAEQSVGPVTLKDPCSCERTEWDQVCETVHYSLQRVDCESCCVDQGCELACHCATGPCCEASNAARDKLKSQYEAMQQDFRTRLRKFREGGMTEGALEKYRLEFDAQLEAFAKQIPPEKEHSHHRGGCRCLCDHLVGLTLDSECHSLCEVDRCARADLRNGISLACLKLDQDECGNWRFASVFDACGPRRLVKRNDLLFDLIRGCDVTRISEIGWRHWHREQKPIAWNDFREALGPKDLKGKVDSVTTLFWVRFSGPVRAETVRADCFAMTIVAAEYGEGWGNVCRVPIVGVSPITEPGEPSEWVRGATLVVDARWVDDAVGNVGDVGRRKNLFEHQQVQVEIEVRGDFIVDCNGQTVDANALGLSRGPTGNGTPGGTFLSTFTVDVRTPDSPPKAKGLDPDLKGV